MLGSLRVSEITQLGSVNCQFILLNYLFANSQYALKKKTKKKECEPEHNAQGHYLDVLQHLRMTISKNHHHVSEVIFCHLTITYIDVFLNSYN